MYLLYYIAQEGLDVPIKNTDHVKNRDHVIVVQLPTYFVWESHPRNLGLESQAIEHGPRRALAPLGPVQMDL